MNDRMTSLERVMIALSHREPDRVPLFLLLTMHGAKELGLSVQEYFSRAENVVEGQMRMLRKYRNDCIYSFFYAAVETEAWGSPAIYCEDGPPNSGPPFLLTASDIDRLEPPDVRHCPCLTKVLDAISGLKRACGGSTPIIGVVMSPFSLPVMQMGFGPYLDLLHESPRRFERLMSVNERFCEEWANAQLEAGAAAICYFDPVSSPTIVPRKLFRKTGFGIACRMAKRIRGPVAMHLASGRCLPIVEDIARIGAAVVGASALDDLAEMKAACSGRIAILGNWNGLEMIGWTPEDAERAVRDSIARAGRGGGYILGENHGEIPFQVSEDTLFAIREAADKWGRYPLDWIDDRER